MTEDVLEWARRKRSEDLVDTNKQLIAELRMLYDMTKKAENIKEPEPIKDEPPQPSELEQLKIRALKLLIARLEHP